MEVKFLGAINQSGILEIKNKNDFALYLASLAGKEVEITIQRKRKTRTDRQNAAIHLWFTLLANALNDAGYDMKKVIRIDIPWNLTNIKEYLWRPVQKSLTGKRSSTQLTTDEIDKIYDVVNRAIAERTGVHIPFPCIDNLIYELGG